MPDVQLARRGPGDLVLTVDGYPHDLRFPPSGNLEQIVLSILGGREYPTLRLDGWTPRTIVDVGANVGATAIFFALAYPEATIRCFEPAANTFRHLKANTAWLPTVEALPFGLSDAPAEVELYGGTAQCAQASVRLSVETRSDRSEVIELRRASTSIGPVEGPAILKIDTEGCEVQILTDLGERVEAFDVVYVEWHSERDRRRIDELLGGCFALWKTKAGAVHRGTAAYLNQRVIAAYPRLGILEIGAPEPGEERPEAGEERAA